jgi:hypothetical protein
MPLITQFLSLEWFLQCERRRQIVAVLERGGSMDPKLAILFLLISSSIGLSHLNDENLGRVRRQLITWRWREFVPGRRKS